MLVPAASAFILTGIFLALAHLNTPFPILMLDRFFQGWAWLEIAGLAVYAAWLVPKMLDPVKARIWRPRIWYLFTFVFFGQLVLGLLGFEQFLMTGKLHLPVPALIAAGPIYRGEGFFMLILFFSTVVLVGPAWCSHLCYVGSWDEAASRATKKRQPMPKARPIIRVMIALLVIATAILLRIAGVPSGIAFFAALGFGLLGVLIMLLCSRRLGQRAHCTTFCPMGLIANLVGKINPFRIKIGPDCTECRACERACRCDALDLLAIRAKRPNLSCTLCGDCVAACRHGQIEYRFLWLRPEQARTLFYVLVVSLHAVFLGVARI
jgi:ferredoxin